MRNAFKLKYKHAWYRFSNSGNRLSNLTHLVGLNRQVRAKCFNIGRQLLPPNGVIRSLQIEEMNRFPSTLTICKPSTAFIFYLSINALLRCSWKTGQCLALRDVHIQIGKQFANDRFNITNGFIKLQFRYQVWKQSF